MPSHDLEACVIDRGGVCDACKHEVVVNNKTLVVDIDGTITNGEYPYKDATPRLDVIAKVNAAYDAGWTIILFTARGMNRFSDMQNKGMDDFGRMHTPVQSAIEEYGRMTWDWLLEHGVKYHHLRFGKPAAIYYIDDKSLTPEAFLEKVI